MDYTLIRASRKSISISIRDAVVVVRAPHRAAKSEIDQFVESKQRWITSKLALAQEAAAKRQQFVITYGSMLLWRGQEYPLLGDSPTKCTWRDDQGFHMPPGCDEPTLKHNVIRLYKSCAKPFLTQRVTHFAKVVGQMPASVTITQAMSRWGSCSAVTHRTPINLDGTAPRGSGHASILGRTHSPRTTSLTSSSTSTEKTYRLNFSWRLCMAEDDIIDAVVVHELAHTKHMNHSAAFYALVRATLPDYDARHAQLRLLSQRLGCEDWSL
ncbi:MAG: M48 family metallopeptidase [Propionibacteriaceae bacterium]|jgi:predicted metal-dependent hydrolase|nr:M48 family metallopeptidase [Propionibacteriaceae bacterium]